MTVVRRMVVPAGGTRPTQEEWYDTEKKRLVPKPEEKPAAAPVAAKPVKEKTK